MIDGPNIAKVASLIGDPARSHMLSALMDGRALTASELAVEAGVTKQTASAHLGKLLEGGLLEKEVQGRCRYFRIADADVAAILEGLMHLAEKRGPSRTRTGPNDPALRHARVCYDHLAGDLGVLMFDRFIENGWLAEEGEGLVLTGAGAAAVSALGVDLSAPRKTRRPSCRRCLDWSARRHHLAGWVGAALFAVFQGNGWARRKKGARVVAFSAEGERAFRAWLSQS